MNNADNDNDAEIQHLLHEMHNMSTRKSPMPHHGAFNSPRHAKAPSTLMKKKSSSTVKVHVHGQPLQQGHNGAASPAVVTGHPRNHGNLSFVQQLQVKYNQVKHALVIQQEQCADLHDVISDLVAAKSHHATQVQALEATVEARDREIRTLRDHVHDLYGVQQTLRAESLQKDIQLQQQQRQPPVLPAALDGCHSCVCHSNAPPIAWSNHPDDGAVVVQTSPIARLDSSPVVQSLRMELDGLETQVASQSAELVRVQTALGEAIERSQVVEDTMRQWAAHLLVRDNQIADVDDENLHGLALLRALSDAITHQTPRRLPDEPEELDGDNRQRGRRNAMLVHPFEPPTEEDLSATTGSAGRDEDRAAMPQWLAEALATVEESMDEASHALDMEVLQMELASLRRSLQRKDDELDAFELLVDSMQGQVGALATRRELVQDSGQSMMDSLLQTVYASTDEPQVDEDDVEEVGLDGMPEESHDSVCSNSPLQSMAQDPLTDEGGERRRDTQPIDVEELPMATSPINSTPDGIECMDETSPPLDDLAVQPSLMPIDQTSAAQSIDPSVLDADKSAVAHEPQARVQSFLDNTLAILHDHSINMADGYPTLMGAVDVHERLEAAAKQILVQVTAQTRHLQGLQDNIADMTDHRRVIESDQDGHVNEECDAVGVRSDALTIVETELSRRTCDLRLLEAALVAKDNEMNVLETELSTASQSLPSLRQDLTLSQAQILALHDELAAQQARHKQQEDATCRQVSDFSSHLHAEMEKIPLAPSCQEEFGQLALNASALHVDDPTTPIPDFSDPSTVMHDSHALVLEAFGALKQRVAEQGSDLHRTIQALQSQISQANDAAAATVRDFDDQRAILQVEMRCQAQASQAKDAMLCDRDGVIDQLRHDLDTQRANLDASRSRMALIEDELATTKTANSELNERVVRQRSDIDALGEKWGVQLAATATKTQECQRLELELDQVTRQVHALEAAVQQHQGMESARQAQVDQLTANHAKESDGLHVRHTVDRLVLMCEWHGMHSALESTVSAWKSQCHAIKASEVRCRDELQACRVDLALAREELVVVREDVAAHERQVITLTGRNDKLEQTLDAMSNESKAFGVKTASLANELAVLSALLANERTKVDQMKKVEDTLLEQLEQRGHELEQCQGECAALMARAETSDRDVDRCKAEIAMAERTLVHKGDEIKSLEDKLATTSELLLATRSELAHRDAECQRLQADSCTQEAQHNQDVDRINALFHSVCSHLQSAMASGVLNGVAPGEINATSDEDDATTLAAAPTAPNSPLGLFEQRQRALLEAFAAFQQRVAVQLDTLHQDNQTLHSRLARANEATADTIRHYDEQRELFQVQLTAQRHVVDEMAASLCQRDAELDQLRMALASETANSSVCRSMAALIEDDLSARKADNHVLKQSEALLKHEIRVLQDSLVARGAAQDAHDEQVRGLERQLDHAMSQVEKAQRDARDADWKQDQIEQLEEEMTSKQQEVVELLCAVAASEAAKDDLQRRWDADKAQSLLEVAACRSECQHLKALLDGKRTEYDTFKADRLAKEATLVQSLQAEFLALESTYEAQLKVWTSRAQTHERTAIQLQHALWAIQLESEMAANVIDTPTSAHVSGSAPQSDKVVVQEVVPLFNGKDGPRPKKAKSEELPWLFHQVRSLALEMEMQQAQHAKDLKSTHRVHETESEQWQHTLIETQAKYDQATQQLMQQLDVAHAVVRQKDKDIALWMDCTLAMQNEIQEVRASQAQVEHETFVALAQVQSELATVVAEASRESKSSVKASHCLWSVQLEMDQLAGRHQAVVAQVDALQTLNEQLQRGMDEIANENHVLNAKTISLVGERTVLSALLANERATVDRMGHVQDELHAQLEQLRHELEQCHGERNKIHQLLESSTVEWTATLTAVKATVRAQANHDRQDFDDTIAHLTELNDTLSKDLFASQRGCQQLRKQVLKWRHCVQSCQLEMDGALARLHQAHPSSYTPSVSIVPTDLSHRGLNIAESELNDLPPGRPTMMAHDLEWTWHVHDQVLEERTNQVHLLQAQLAHATAASPPTSPSSSSSDPRIVSLKRRLDAATAENHALCGRLTDLTLDNHRLMLDLLEKDQQLSTSTTLLPPQATEATFTQDEVHELQHSLDVAPAETAPWRLAERTLDRPHVLSIESGSYQPSLSSCGIPSVESVAREPASEAGAVESDPRQPPTSAPVQLTELDMLTTHTSRSIPRSMPDETFVEKTLLRQNRGQDFEASQGSTKDNDAVDHEREARVQSLLDNAMAVMNSTNMADSYHGLLDVANVHEKLETTAKHLLAQVTAQTQQFQALQDEVASQRHVLESSQTRHLEECNAMRERLEAQTTVEIELSRRVDDLRVLETTLAAKNDEIKTLATEMATASQSLQVLRGDLALIRMKSQSNDVAAQTAVETTEVATVQATPTTSEATAQTTETHNVADGLQRRLDAAMVENVALCSRITDLTVELHRLSDGSVNREPSTTASEHASHLDVGSADTGPAESAVATLDDGTPNTPQSLDTVSVEDSTNDASNALEMEALQMELALLRRSLKQKDDELNALTMLVDSMQGREEAIAARRQLVQESSDRAVHSSTAQTQQFRTLPEDKACPAIAADEVHHLDDEGYEMKVRSEALTVLESELSRRMDEIRLLETALAAKDTEIKTLEAELSTTSHSLQQFHDDMALVRTTSQSTDAATQIGNETTQEATVPATPATLQAITQTTDSHGEGDGPQRRLDAAVAENAALCDRLTDLTLEVNRLSNAPATLQPSESSSVAVASEAVESDSETDSTESDVSTQAAIEPSANMPTSRDVFTISLPIPESTTDTMTTWDELAEFVQKLLSHAAKVAATTEEWPEQRHRLVHRLRRQLVLALQDPHESVACGHPIVVVVHRLTSLVRTLATLLEQPSNSKATMAGRGSSVVPLATVRRKHDTPFHPSASTSRQPLARRLPVLHHAATVDSTSSFVAAGGGIVLLDVGATEVRTSFIPRRGLVAATGAPVLRFPTTDGGDGDAANIARAFDWLGLSATHLAHVKVVLLHKPRMDPAVKEQLTTLLLHGFQVQGVNLTTHAQAALMGCHAHTGLVVDVGHAATHLVPVFEDMVLEHAVMKLDGGGSAVAKHILAHVRETNPAKCFQAVSATACMVDIERRLVEGRRDADWPASCCDVFFQGPDDLAIAVRACVEACDPLLHAALFGNIVLTGGAAALPGLAERLELEVRRHVPAATGRVHVHVASNVFVGAASHATTLSPYKWVLQDDFRLHGARIVHAKCF